MAFEVYDVESRESRWQFIDGHSVATSVESFAAKGNARRAIEDFERQVERASVPSPEPDEVR